MSKGKEDSEILFCEACGTKLIITLKIVGYYAHTGKPRHETNWRCPKWKWFDIFHFHTNFSGMEGFDEARESQAIKNL